MPRSPIRSLLALLLVSAPLASAACMWWGPGLDRPALVLADLRSSQDTYNDDCARWAEPRDANDAPARHVDDIYFMTDDMAEACNDLVRDGRIDRSDSDRIGGMRDRLRDAADAHRGRFNDLADGDAMHDECANHHLEVLELFDETEDDLRAGGMMGGGGMM